METIRKLHTSDNESDSAKDESRQACSSERPPSPILPIGKPKGRRFGYVTFGRLQQQKFSEALESTIHKCGFTSMDLNTSGEERLATDSPPKLMHTSDTDSDSAKDESRQACSSERPPSPILPIGKPKGRRFGYVTFGRLQQQKFSEALESTIHKCGVTSMDLNTSGEERLATDSPPKLMHTSDTDSDSAKDESRQACSSERPPSPILPIGKPKGRRFGYVTFGRLQQQKFSEALESTIHKCGVTSMDLNTSGEERLATDSPPKLMHTSDTDSDSAKDESSQACSSERPPSPLLLPIGKLHTSDNESDSAKDESRQACSSERPPSPILPIGKPKGRRFGYVTFGRLQQQKFSEALESTIHKCGVTSMDLNTSGEERLATDSPPKLLHTSDNESDSAKDESRQACSSERPPSPILPIGKPKGRRFGYVTFGRLQQQKFSEALESTIHKCGVTSMDLNTSGEERLATDSPPKLMHTSDTDSDSAKDESRQACSSERPPSPILPIGKPKGRRFGYVTFGRLQQQKFSEALESTIHKCGVTSMDLNTSGEERLATDSPPKLMHTSDTDSDSAKDESSQACSSERPPSPLLLPIGKLHTSDNESDSAKDESRQACSSERPPSPLLPIGKPKGRRFGYVTFGRLQQQKFSEALESTIHKCGVTSMDLNTSGEERLATDSPPKLCGVTCMDLNTSGEERLATETPLGSLEGTEVPLGHFNNTRESRKLIRAEWGTRGTMHKIFGCIKSGSSPVDVHSLVSQGPVVSGQRRLIAARCFNSILKLKQHGFIKIRKDSETLEIKDIEFGDKIFRDD